MFLFDTVIQTEYGSFFKAFALPGDEKPTTGVCPGSKIEEFNPETGAVDTYRFNGTAWVKIDANGTPAGGGGSSGGGVTIVYGTYNEETEESTLDMKAGELYEMCKSGVVIARIGTTTSILEESDHTEVGYVFNIGGTNFAADTADDYPTASDSDDK